MPGLWNRVAPRQQQLITTANVAFPRDAVHMCFQIQSEGFSPPQHLLKRKADNPYAKLKKQPNQYPAILLMRRIITVTVFRVAKRQRIWSALLPLQTKSWLPFKALWFLVGDMILCSHPTHLPVQTPDTKAAERFPLLWVCILYSDICQEPSVVKTAVGCFGRQAHLKTQRQNLRSCPGDFVVHIFRSGITLSTGLW